MLEQIVLGGGLAMKEMPNVDQKWDILHTRFKKNNQISSLDCDFFSQRFQ
jgi:hypothetical protein